MTRNFKHRLGLALCFILSGVCCASADDSGQTVNVGHGLIEKLVKRVEDLEKAVRFQAAVNREQGDLIENMKEKLVVVERELTVLKSRQLVTGNKKVPDEKPNLHNLPENPETTVVPSVRRAIRQVEVVAFTAYLDHNLSHLGINHPIVYDKIITNVGNGYNNNTGIFTCPLDGIYIFNFLVSTTGVQQIVAKLVVDNVNMVDGISDTFHAAHEAQGGNYVILSLKQGQSVWVANYRWTDKGATSSEIYRFSTFSGHLML